ncbi:MAG: hypothetical protein CMJ18_17215 [Phycisphaeraceae bacterium]|nr:hypothetical protein [Phycisphaeraceae bacterium]
MSAGTKLLLGLVIIAAAYAVSKSFEEPVPPLEGWHHDVNVAAEQSQATGRPMLALFSASWCGACSSLKRHALSKLDVQTELSEVVPVEVDVTDDDDNAGLAEQMRVYGLPTMIIFAEDGRELGRLTGSVSKKYVTAWVEQCLAKGERSG